MRTLMKTNYIEASVLGVLASLDLIYTIWLISTGRAVEANPVLSWSLKHGILCFTWVKILSYMVPLIIIDKILPYSARIQLLLRLAIILYVAEWVIGVIKINS